MVLTPLAVATPAMAAVVGMAALKALKDTLLLLE
jgi:hypothetical protein